MPYRLETPRLALVPLTEDDAPFMLELLNEPGFLRHIGDRGVRTVDDARVHIREGPRASYEAHGFGPLRVVLRVTAEPVGICGLFQRTYLDEPDLGFALLERHWSRGYAREAAEAVMTHAADTLGLCRLLATTALDNLASRGLLERLGFRFDGTIRIPGKDGESALYGWEPAPET